MSPRVSGCAALVDDRLATVCRAAALGSLSAVMPRFCAIWTIGLQVAAEQLVGEPTKYVLDDLAVATPASR